ncbi:beta-ribofuranosylaminobenzene 5'-phosphate synthase family protein [Tautonia rosea]|uniref:beta-ribofuranosylaminobenzene 5'-phosphate synthase family protein n=1 Tax=Tautonia rosea TaxID=2728037 RepID=UPI001476674C|nr:beta-ribofuranosylaminobenzene 5'-phosphate synthase family protein [Tautonia rosea]
MILEGIVTTLGPDGSLNIAPMGPIVESPTLDRFTLRPYTSSTTYRNLKALGEGVLHVTDDVLMIARGAIGRLNDAPTRPADVVKGRILTSSCRYVEFRVTQLDDRDERTTIHCEAVARGTLRDFFGLNRAKHAVVEAAILATRTDFLHLPEILEQYDRFSVLIDKTAGPDEEKAFALLRDHVHAIARRRGVPIPGSSDVVVPRAVCIQTPSRLHFGPLAWGPEAGRRFGGVGLMIEQPGVELRAQRSDEWAITGMMGQRPRVSDFSSRVLFQLARKMDRARAMATHIHMDRAIPEHVGLGSGTQLGLAVARAITLLNGKGDLPVQRLAQLAGRGARSGIGILGFERGGLIVDGGHRASGAIPPLVARATLPDDWAVLVAIPTAPPGLHGEAERLAFRDLPPMPDSLSDRLCRLVLLGLLPAVAERDLPAFGAALVEIQSHVGDWFSPAQGGRFACPEVEQLARFLSDRQLHGVGQSSWGPALYAFDNGPPDRRDALLAELRDRFSLRPSRCFWTRASSSGASWESIDPLPTDLLASGH